MLALVKRLLFNIGYTNVKYIYCWYEGAELALSRTKCDVQVSRIDYGVTYGKSNAPIPFSGTHHIAERTAPSSGRAFALLAQSKLLQIRSTINRLMIKNSKIIGIVNIDVSKEIFE